VIGYAAGYARHKELDTYLGDKDLMRVCAMSTKELYKLCELRGVDLRKFPEASFVNFPVWLISILVRWNIRRNESAQRYTAHVSNEGSLQETKAYYTSVMKTADELGFEMPHTKSVGSYLQHV